MQKKNNSELFTTMSVGRSVAKLAIPTVISQIVVILYSLADTFFVGQIGDPNQLAALSITFPIFTLLTAVANLFGIGANSVISRSLGKNDKATAKKASSFGFWASIVVTAILAIILGVFMNPILKFFKADNFTLEFSAKYLFWVFVIGGIPTVAGLILGHLVRAVGKTKEASIGLSLGGILNIILDPIFIFEKGDTIFNGALTMPFGFGMDVSGTAVATMISNTISMLYFFVVLISIRKTTVLSINPKRFSLEKNVAFDTCAVGFPAAISVLLVSVSIAVLNGLLLGHENGNILSAAYGVTSKCGTIALHISIGIAQCVMPLIGFSYGAKNYKRIHQVCSLSFKILWIFSIVFLIIIQFMPTAIASIFTPHEETIQVAATFMRCWSWCVIGMSLFNMYNSIFQAVGKWKTSLLLAVLRLGIIFTVLSYVMDALWGVTGLMWVQAVTDTLAFIIAAVLYARFKKSIMKEAKSTPAPVPAKTSKNRVIAISREFGSGGRTIDKEVAAKLGIPCYDSEIIEKISAETGFAKEYVEKYGEYAVSNSLYNNALAGRTYDGKSDADKLWLAQKEVITKLAEKSPCVIIGRCADYILRDTADCLSVFIHASDENRAERIVSVYGQREDAPAKRLHDKDKKRKAFYELYTGTSWGEADNYTVCLDSGVLGTDKCVDIIKDLF
ncbi:MAG: MATE family efflux transporter [Candidatus Limousia pullorum]